MKRVKYRSPIVEPFFLSCQYSYDVESQSKKPKLIDSVQRAIRLCVFVVDVDVLSRPTAGTDTKTHCVNSRGTIFVFLIVQKVK